MDGQKDDGITAPQVILQAQRCEYYWPKSSVACTLSLSVRVQCSKGKGRFVQYQKFIVSSTVCLCFWLNRTSWSNGLSSIEKRPLHCGLVRFTWQGSPCCMFSYQIAVFADFYCNTGAFKACHDCVRWGLYRFVNLSSAEACCMLITLDRCHFGQRTILRWTWRCWYRIYLL